MSKIQFEDKVQVQERPEFSDNQKVNANNINEIKNVVNENDENAVYKDGVKTINGQSILGEGNLIITGEGGDTLPIGSMLPYGNVNPPANWLVCDGSAVSRTTYADLFSIIGTTYGEGDGSTTFNLPNKKGRVSAGYDANNEQFNAIGKQIGEEKHIMTIEELVTHDHTYNRTWGGSSATDVDGKTQAGYGDASYWGDGTTNDTGNSQPFNIIQPTEVDQWIIKAFQSVGVVANVAQAKTNSDTDTYSCNYVNKIGRRVQIFNGSVVMNNVITIATTWEHIGKFKNLIIECGEGNINIFCSAIIPFEQLATGDKLTSGKLNSNIFAPIYIGTDKNNYLHLIPNDNIGENTIKFDGISDTAIVRNIYVDY